MAAPRPVTETYGIAIGDPIGVKEPEGPVLGWKVTYHGQARSHTIGDTTWRQGQTLEIEDMSLVMRARRTAHFQVLPPKAVVKRGRVHAIWERGGQWADDAVTHEFVVVAVSGALRGCNSADIRTLSDEEVTELEQEELKEVMEGRVPYRGRLRLAGKGKWKRGTNL